MWHRHAWESLVSLEAIMGTRHNYIAPMGWETSAVTMLGVSLDQFRFFMALLASIPMAAAVRMLGPTSVRHMYATLVGFLLVYYPFGFGVIHAVVPCTLVYLSMLLAPGSCGSLAWLICFPYLIYLHVVNASGSNWQLGLLDFTGCEMVLVLKLIAIAVARQDHWLAKRKGKVLSAYQAEYAVEATPGPLQYLSFVFGLGNLLAGPYIEYVDYKNFMERKGVWSPGSKQPNPIKHVLFCTFNAFFWLGAHQLLFPTWNRNLVLSHWYSQQSALIKLLSCFLLSFTCQTKFVFAWRISEASLSAAGLNFEGWDDKTGEAKWGRYENVRFEVMLLSDSARLVVSHWNVGTARFLRRYVYERLTLEGRKPGFPQLLATQLVSAVWHGLYPGYLMFFAGSAFWLNFATVLHKTELLLLPTAWQSFLPLRMLKILWTHLVLNYLATSFMVLEFWPCLQVWASLHYVPVLIIVVGSFLGPLLLGLLGGKRPRRGSKKDGVAANGANGEQHQGVDQ